MIPQVGWVMCYSFISPDRRHNSALLRVISRHAKFPTILDNILIRLSSKVHETDIRDETVAMCVWNYITMYISLEVCFTKESYLINMTLTDSTGLQMNATHGHWLPR